MSGKRVLRISVLLLSLALVAESPRLGLQARAQDAGMEELIQNTIDNRHPSENEPDWWRSLGPGAPKVIMKMYREAEGPYERMRLLQALAWYDDSEAAEFLKNEARGTEDELIRAAAVKTVGRAQGEKELPFLEEFLKHPDPNTRLAAASAVQRIAADSSRAQALLDQYKRGEKTSWVVSKLERQQEARERAQVKVQPGPGTAEPLLEALPGSWKGQWLEPDPKKEGLRPTEVETTLSADGGQLKGTFLIGAGKERRQFSIESSTVKGSEIQGVLVVPAPPAAPGKPAPAPEKFSFKGEWKRREGHSLLTLDVSRLAATAVLRKK